MGITLHSNHPPDARNHTRIGEALSEPGRNHISFNTGWLIIDYGFLGQGRTEPILEVIHHQPHTRCQHVHPLDIDVAVFTDGSLLHGRWSEIPAAGASATQVDAEGNPVVSVLLTLPDHATLSAIFAEHAAVLLALQHPSPCETIAIISDCASVITAQQLSFTYALSPGRPMAGVWNDIRSEPAAVRLATRVRTHQSTDSAKARDERFHFAGNAHAYNMANHAAAKAERPAGINKWFNAQAERATAILWTTACALGSWPPVTEQYCSVGIHRPLRPRMLAAPGHRNQYTWIGAEWVCTRCLGTRRASTTSRMRTACRPLPPVALQLSARAQALVHHLWATNTERVELPLVFGGACARLATTRPRLLPAAFQGIPPSSAARMALTRLVRGRHPTSCWSIGRPWKLGNMGLQRQGAAANGVA